MPQITAQEKFDTCRHRSADSMTLGIASCCGAQLKNGFVCFRRSIDGVLIDHCADCQLYSPRLVLEENSENFDGITE